MEMVRGGGYLALPLGTPSRGAVGPRPTEGLPDFGLLPIGKREGDVKKTPVIPPKGTRRQINESWYAAVARSEATWESVLLNAVLKHTAVQKRNGLPRPVTSVTGLAMTEVVFILPFLLPNGTLSTPATPQALTRQLP